MKKSSNSLRGIGVGTSLMLLPLGVGIITRLLAKIIQNDTTIAISAYLLFGSFISFIIGWITVTKSLQKHISKRLLIILSLFLYVVIGFIVSGGTFGFESVSTSIARKPFNVIGILFWPFLILRFFNLNILSKIIVKTQ